MLAASEIYSQKPEPGDPVARNWTIFGTASEQARIHGDHENFVERIFLPAVDPEISDG